MDVAEALLSAARIYRIALARILRGEDGEDRGRMRWFSRDEFLEHALQNEPSDTKNALAAVLN
jgi:hypothetical protein